MSVKYEENSGLLRVFKALVKSNLQQTVPSPSGVDIKHNNVGNVHLPLASEIGSVDQKQDRVLDRKTMASQWIPESCQPKPVELLTAEILESLKVMFLVFNAKYAGNIAAMVRAAQICPLDYHIVAHCQTKATDETPQTSIFAHDKPVKQDLEYVSGKTLRTLAKSKTLVAGTTAVDSTSVQVVGNTSKHRKRNPNNKIAKSVKRNDEKAKHMEVFAGICESSDALQHQAVPRCGFESGCPCCKRMIDNSLTLAAFNKLVQHKSMMVRQNTKSVLDGLRYTLTSDKVMTFKWLEGYWRNATDRYIVVLEPHFPTMPHIQTRNVLDLFSQKNTQNNAQAIAGKNATEKKDENKRETLAEQALCHGVDAWINKKNIQVAFVFGGEENGIDAELLYQLSLWNNVMFASIRTRTRRTDDNTNMFSLNLSSAVLYIMSVLAMSQSLNSADSL